MSPEQELAMVNRLYVFKRPKATKVTPTKKVPKEWISRLANLRANVQSSMKNLEHDEL